MSFHYLSDFKWKKTAVDEISFEIEKTQACFVDGKAYIFDVSDIMINMIRTKAILKQGFCNFYKTLNVSQDASAS